MTVELAAGRALVAVAGARFTVPVPDGWSVGAHPDVALVLVHGAAGAARQSAITLAVQAAAPACDPRAVAARLARLARSADGRAAEVQERHFGWFGERQVAIQVLTMSDAAQLQAVFVEHGPSRGLFVVVCTCARDAIDRVGPAFAEVVAGVAGFEA